MSLNTKVFHCGRTGEERKKRRNGRGGKWHPKIQLHVFYYILLLLYSTRWSQDLDCSQRQQQQQQQKRGQKDIKKKMHALAARAHVLAAEACSRQINIRIVQQIRYQWSSLAEDSFDSSWLLRGFFFLLWITPSRLRTKEGFQYGRYCLSLCRHCLTRSKRP